MVKPITEILRDNVILGNTSSPINEPNIKDLREWGESVEDGITVIDTRVDVAESDINAIEATVASLQTTSGVYRKIADVNAQAPAAANVNLAAPGASLDGYTFVSSGVDRFAAPYQTVGSQNGIYIWNGAASPATRATDVDSSAEISNGPGWLVTGGAQAGKGFQFIIEALTIGVSTPRIATTNLTTVTKPSSFDALRGVGTALASASAMTIQSATGDTVPVSGVATINTLGSTTAGVRRTLTMTGTPTFAASASILGLPGNVNYVAAVGDVLQFKSEGSNVWTLEFGTNALGKPIALALAENTADINKPISILTQAAIDTASVAQTQSLKNIIAYENSGAIFDFAELGPLAFVKDPINFGNRYLGDPAALITCVRNGSGSAGYCDAAYFDRKGLLKFSTANTLRYPYDALTLQPRGLQSEPARSNQVKQSRHLDVNIHLTVTGGSGTFTDGESLTCTGGGTGIYRASDSSATVFAVTAGTGTFSGTLTGGTSGATKTISSSAAVWTATNMTIARTATGLDGVANSCSQLTATAANATVLQAVTLASSQRQGSIYIKRMTGSGVVNMTTDGGATWSPLTFDTKFGLASIPAQTVTNPSFGLQIVTSGDSIIVDAFQNENGPEVTSPIICKTTALTRDAERLTSLSSAFPSMANGGLIMVEAETDGIIGSIHTAIQFDDGTTNNRFFINTNTSTNPIIQAALYSASAIQANIICAASILSKQYFKGAFSFALNNFLAASDGVSGTPDVSGVMPVSLSRIIWGAVDTFGSSSLIGCIKRLIFVPRIGTAAEVSAISSFGWPGDEPIVNIAPNDSRINFSDYAATLNISSAAISGTRPITFGTYENANPGMRVRFNTSAPGFQIALGYTNLVTGAYNGIGIILVDGSIFKTFNVGAGINQRLFVPMKFSSLASRLIEVIMPYSASVNFQGLALPNGAPIYAPSARPTTRMVVGGDSRMHGFNGTDISKSGAWLLSQSKNWQLINTANGSSRIANCSGAAMANLNPDVALFICDYNNRTDQTNPTTFKTAYKQVLTDFRAIKPTTKFYCISGNWTSTANNGGVADGGAPVGGAGPWTMADYRAAIVAGISEIGSAYNIYVDGLTLTANNTTDIPDGIHPGDTGWSNWEANIRSTIVL